MKKHRLYLPDEWKYQVWRNFTANPRISSQKTELEMYMREAGIVFERLQDRVIPKLSDVYISRYGLSETDAQKVRVSLGEKDYAVQTSWLILPSEKK